MPVHSLSPRDRRRNFVLGVIDGFTFKIFLTVTDPTVVLTWFVTQLTSSPLAVGLLMPLSRGGGLLPQVLLCGYLQRQPRKMRYYLLGSVARIGSWFILTAAVFLFGNRSPTMLLVSFLLFYALHWLADGAGALPWTDVVAKVIAPEQRGSFFAWRNFTGAVCALGAGVVVARVLNDKRLPFPTDYGVLFALGGLALLVGAAAFARTREPDEDSVIINRPTFSLRQTPQLLRADANYTRFIVARVMTAVASVALPFYTVFVKEQLQAPADMVGVYLGAYLVASVASALVWGWLSDRYGNHAMFLASLILSAPLPFVPLLLGARVAYSFYVLVFALLGVTQNGTLITSYSTTLDIVPAEQRVAYLGVLNTIQGVASLALMGSGLVAARWGLSPLFAISALAGIVAPMLLWPVRIPELKKVTV